MNSCTTTNIKFMVKEYQPQISVIGVQKNHISRPVIRRILQSLINQTKLDYFGFTFVFIPKKQFIFNIINKERIFKQPSVNVFLEIIFPVKYIFISTN